MTLTAPQPTTSVRDLAARVAEARVRRSRRRLAVITVLTSLILAAVLVNLMFGRTFYPIDEVLRVAMGEDIPGASFTVGRLRIPRTLLALGTGLSFGLAGVTFQTLLRNPLASPDIIGITSGASAAAILAIITLGLSSTGVSIFAVVAGIGVALAVYLLAYRNGVAGTRLILIGIGVSAMMESLIAAQLERASNFQLAEALRWLTGSLNNSRWEEVIPVYLALAVLGSFILCQARNLTTSQLGDDAASALGVRVELTRVIVVIAAVGLICIATAAAGPVAFVAFLSGPIAARLVGPNGSLLLPAALVGALLVLVADFAGQYAFGIKMPVGVITGVLGAPFLIYLIVRINRAGASL